MTVGISDLAGLVTAAVGDHRCVVALGGGADSASLLAAAAEANLEDLRAIFVDHGLVGSARLRRAAEDVAALHGIPLTVVDAPTADGPDLEARARHARYRAIESVLGSGDVCCTAHTLNDQAETVVMRMARGAGATGLRGIPHTRGQFTRPFLGVSRSVLRAVAIENELPFIDDPANSDDRFLRTRVRSDVIPTLEDVFGADVTHRLSASAGLIAADDRLLEWMADKLSVTAEMDAGTAIVSIPAAVLSSAPAPVAARAVRTALAHFHDPYRGSASDVDAVRSVAASGGQRTVSTDIVCARENALVVLYREENVPRPADTTIRLDDVIGADGVTAAWGEHSYAVSISRRPSLASTVGRRSALAHGSDHHELVLRGASEGDRIDIESGSTPVSELLRAAGVTVRRRPYWLVITIGGKIAAVHGIRVAPWARPAPGEPAVVIEREGRL